MMNRHLRPLGGFLFASFFVLGLASTFPMHTAMAQAPVPAPVAPQVQPQATAAPDQEAELEEPGFEEPAEEGLVPDVPQPGVPRPAARPAPGAATTTEEELPPLDEPLAGGEAREGQTSWTIRITGAVRANYVYRDSPDSYVVKYRWEVKGAANANTAVIRGDADINAQVEGYIAKWPTGECKLEVTIPKVPFEITFQRSGEDKGNVALNFKKAITEDWQSRCTFTDAPGAKFDTRGDPEKILSRAIDKARPPLRSIIANLTRDETTTSFVINKETIDDAPLGSIEIEGTGVVTITPAGAGAAGITAAR